MQKLLLPFFLVGTVVMMLVMTKTGSSLKTPSTPMGIIDLEFAWNVDKVDGVISAWAPSSGSNNIRTAKLNTWWDFAFLFFYTGFLFLACKGIASKHKGWFGKAGLTIAKLAIAAGILDILENLGMLLILDGKGSAAIALATTCVSIIKWAFALIAVLYVLSGFAGLVFRKNA
jgi:hypothetical protein